MSSHVVVFGASGFLGQAITSELKNQFPSGKISVVTRGEIESVALDGTTPAWVDEIAPRGPVTGVVWAQGQNISDSIHDWKVQSWDEVMYANLKLIIESTQIMLNSSCFGNKARLLIISSVWQELGRGNKLSYSVTKSAIRGLVLSLVSDLGERQIAVNAILPGVVDSPMARKNLNPEQISAVEKSTPNGYLVTAEQIARVSAWLLSESSQGINGQFIEVDNGWSRHRDF